MQIELLAPLLPPTREPDGDSGYELSEALVVCGELWQRPAGRGGEIGAENGPGGMVGHAYAQLAADRDDSRGKPRENDRQALALALDRLLAVQSLLAGAS